MIVLIFLLLVVIIGTVVLLVQLGRHVDEENRKLRARIITVESELERVKSSHAKQINRLRDRQDRQQSHLIATRRLMPDPADGDADR